MSSPSTATHVIEGLLERTNEASRIIQSHKGNVSCLTTSITETLSRLGQVLCRLIASPFFQSPIAEERNFDQTIFLIAVNACGRELDEFIVQWTEVTERYEGLPDEEYSCLINTTDQRVTEAISVYTEAFQSCLTIEGRQV